MDRAGTTTLRFLKGYSAQYAVVRLFEKFKISLNDGGKAGAVLMDLSKAFDCMRHDLLIGNLYAYGFSHVVWTIGGGDGTP